MNGLCNLLMGQRQVGGMWYFVGQEVLCPLCNTGTKPQSTNVACNVPDCLPHSITFAYPVGDHGQMWQHHGGGGVQ